jgi:tripartite-type tricarboxylate transporter receptor subunit TctC
MKLPHRRQFLHLAAGAAALPAVTHIAQAQSYPSRPVRCIVGYPAGGGTDIFVRLVGQPLSDRIGQPLVIENRPGATSNIATEAVVRAAADGYTLIATDAAAAINATLFDNLNFNFVRDIAVVGMAGVRTFFWCILLFQPGRCRNSLLMPKQIRARSAWVRPALEIRAIWLVNCSR